jgi:ferric-dicitrate binding protein FerR (iron transport regulator)
MMMTAPTVQIDSASLEELRRGDEKALERFFRSSYAGLITEAKAQLGADSSGSSRVVERAFARVWKERESFATPEALDTFVHGAVHEAAVRERSRLGALHRFEANERVQGGAAHKAPAEATMDEAWTHVQQQIHAGEGGKDLRAQTRAQSSHEAAAHMRSVSKEKSWVLPVVGVAATGLAIIGVISFLAKGSSNAALTNGLIASDAKNFQTGSAQISMIELNDGTKVKLAPDSRLRVPQKFGNTVHGARIDGAAEFTASLQEANPIEIRAGRASIFIAKGVADITTDSVRGTVFLRMREGDANVRLGKEAPRPVAAGSALMIDSVNASQPDSAALAEAVGWTDGRVSINNRPLKATLAAVKRWWGLELYLKDTTLSARPVSLNASLDSPKEAISSLEQGGNLKFGYEGKTMVLTDAPAAAKPAAKPAPKQAAKKK